MNKSLATYNPRVRPLRYDSLEPDTRVRRIVISSLSGSRVRNLFAFTGIRIEAPSVRSSEVFEQPAATSYADGPLNTGEPPPFPARWAGWVSDSGIRLARRTEIAPPANSTGFPSQLYPDTTPDRLSIGFNMNGLLAIAIETGSTEIEIKRYTDEDGTTATTAFTGRSPALFNTARLHFGGEQEYAEELVCLYYKRDTPTSLFARFEGDDFATEHELLTGLIVRLSRLIEARAEGGLLALYGVDEDGRNVRITSDSYRGDTGPNGGTIGIAFTGGVVYASAVTSSPDPDRSSIGVAFSEGRCATSVSETEVIDPGGAAIGVVFSGGTVN